MNVDNAKSKMRKGMLEYCVLLLLSKEASYANDIIGRLKQAELMQKSIYLFGAKPEVIEGSFKVVQVLPDGSALATYDEIFTNKLEGGLRYGTAVKFLATEESAFYDNQIINLSKGECFRIIGTYHYMNVEGNEKTVPVIGIFKK